MSFTPRVVERFVRTAPASQSDPGGLSRSVQGGSSATFFCSCLSGRLLCCVEQQSRQLFPSRRKLLLSLVARSETLASGSKTKRLCSSSRPLSRRLNEIPRLNGLRRSKEKRRERERFYLKLHSVIFNPPSRCSYAIRKTRSFSADGTELSADTPAFEACLLRTFMCPSNMSACQISCVTHVSGTCRTRKRHASDGVCRQSFVGRISSARPIIQLRSGEIWHPYAPTYRITRCFFSFPLLVLLSLAKDEKPDWRG